MRYFLTLSLLLFPFSSQAALVISEVAWMGSAASANDEWIEIYNNGVAMNVDGWHLRDGMNLDIALAGSIAAGQYAVFERTDDTSAPGTAFLVYTGALTNAGATLSLYDASGNVVEQLAGGENWENIGGDNVTKETAQYTSNGWITAAPTPGQVNATVGSASGSDDEESEAVDESSRTTGAAVRSSSKEVDSPTSLYLIPRELSVSIEVPQEVFVNQAVDFAATPSGLSKVIMQSLQYEWNFGDFSTSNDVSPTHRYAHPGNYVVTLRASYKEYEALFRKSIVVLPVVVSLSQAGNGDWQVHNNARYEVDVSGYTLGRMTFPERSIMLAGSTIVVPRKEVGNQAVLHDEMQSVVATVGHTARTSGPIPEVRSTVVATTPAPLLSRTVETASEQPASNFSFASASPESLPVETVAGAATTVASAPATPTPLTQQPPSSSSAPATDNRMYYGLLALIGLGLFGIYARQY